jgi:photosystem II stability/assembly factor-like uncharacterized protein
MIRSRLVATALLALSLLNACNSNNGSSANPPVGGLTAVAGDGSIVVTWADDLSIDYWLFVSTDSTMTTENFSTRTDIRVIRSAHSPYVLCGYPDGRTLYMAMNGRTGGGPGGAGTPTVNASMRAAGGAWSLGTAPATDFSAVGYASITTCLANSLPTGIFAAVGPNAAIATSTDGRTFTARTPPTGFTTDLNAVATFTTNLNVPTNPGLRIVAVGAGGASIVSTDGVTWTAGAAFNSAAAALRGVGAFVGTFIAVGDGGVAQATVDGETWTAHPSNVTANLQGIGCGVDRCIAVGDGGTIIRVFDAGVTWTTVPITTTPALKKIAYGNFNNNLGAPTTVVNTWVAVGDAGAVLYSKDGGTTWTATSVAGAGDFVALAYLTKFMAIDSAGNSFTSADGVTWSSAVPTGLTAPRGAIGNGAGYVAVGTGGGTASSF